MKTNWFLMGDIHGEAGPIRYFYYNNRELLHLDECENNMILLGDVGCNYYVDGVHDLEIKNSLQKLPFTFICLRGNHESRVETVAAKFPERWKTIEKYNGLVYIENEFPNIEYLVDGPAIYNFAGYKTISIPGAYSIDKDIRLERGWQWFDDEQLTEEEMAYGKNLIREEKNIDLVISHTCPIAFEPKELFLSGIDQSKVDKTMEVFLGEVEDSLNYKRWAWGHFHADKLYPWDGNREKLMLYNECVDMIKFMEMKKTDYFDDIK